MGWREKGQIVTMQNDYKVRVEVNHSSLKVSLSADKCLLTKKTEDLFISHTAHIIYLRSLDKNNWELGKKA